jgi:3-oxoacyl-[acyl-carrier protein] reductase
MKLSFSGRRALILGGTCDLAICLATMMADDGLFPVLTSRKKSRDEDLSDRIPLDKGKYEIVHMDLSDPGSADTLFDNLKDDPDYLVDFAQGDFERLIATADSEHVYKYFENNISFRALVLKRAARAMLKKRIGRLIFVSSTAAIMPNPGQGFYAASKLASEALYRNLGLELCEKGITTMSLCPGYVKTGRGEKYLKSHEGEILEKIPIKRALTEKEVAEAIMFFLSDSAVGFNATTVTMDGGLTAGK